MLINLISDESTQKLGIGVHQKRFYSFETSFLNGTIVHDSTHRDFNVMASPNYAFMSGIVPDSSPSALRAEFNEARSQTVTIGQYPTLDVVDQVVTKIDDWYKIILKKFGAKNRLLIEEGNSLHLLKHDDALPSPYGNVIIQARTLNAFQALRQNETLDYKTLVGKIMPVILTGLGFNKVHIEHDTSSISGEVKFILEEVGVFAFYKPQKPGKPPYIERYTYSNGDYHRSFSGEATGDVIKHMMYDWLVDAALELELVAREDISAYLDEKALDIIQSRPQAKDNIVYLGQRRQP